MAASSGRASGRDAVAFLSMNSIELNDEELRLVVSAVRSYLDDFGHDEADLLRRLKELLRKLEAASAG